MTGNSDSKIPDSGLNLQYYYIVCRGEVGLGGHEDATGGEDFVGEATNPDIAQRMELCWNAAYGMSNAELERLADLKFPQAVETYLRESGHYDHSKKP